MGEFTVDAFEAEAIGHLRALTDSPEAEFRHGQLDAIRAAVESRGRVLVVQRTGWGKSAVYFVATRMLRDRGLGPTLLLSPLISLMDNQVEAASRMGLRAAVVNSTNAADWDQIRAELAADTIDLLLISEMRLANDRFRRDFLPEFNSRVGLLVVDEVHCISDWGHDFRPNYRRIKSVLSELASSTPVIGCTATANDRVVADVESQFGDGIVTVRGPLGRDGLRLEVHTDKRRPDARLAWLVENIPRLPGSGIVYCLTRGAVFRVAEFLEEHGITCGRYVGGGGAEEQFLKERDLASFLANGVKCIVATSALGMGYDKPDVGWVVHYQMPQSAIAYYQQVGRAGRALGESYGILLAGTEDRDIQDWFIGQAFPSAEEVDSILLSLEEAGDGLKRGQISARTNLSTARLDNVMVQLEVEGAVERHGSSWMRTTEPWQYPHERLDAVNEWRRGEQAAMEEYLAHDGCRMHFLRRQLDDKPTGPCGICDNCRDAQFGTGASADLVAEADRLLRNDHVEIAPRKRWAVGGNIAANERLEVGWCLTPIGESGWGPDVGRGRADGHFDDELLDPIVAMLRQRLDPIPGWLTWVPSARRPTLVADFATRLADRLGVPAVEMFAVARETAPQAEMHNSNRQFDNVDGAFALLSDPPSGPGILFDDLIDSRWTVTVLGALLRRAGSGPIVPVGLAGFAA